MLLIPKEVFEREQRQNQIKENKDEIQQNSEKAAPVKTEKEKNEILLKRLKSAPIPLILVRLCPFYPIEKLTQKAKIKQDFEKQGYWEHENAHGRVVVSEKELIFKHYKVLLTLLKHGRLFIDKYNRISVMFTIYDIAKKAFSEESLGGKLYSFIKETIDDLYKASIEIVRNEKVTDKFHIISREIETAHGHFVIHFSNEFTELLEQEILYSPPLHFDNMHVAYISMYMLTHSKEFTISFENLIEVLGFPKSKRSTARVKKSLRENTDILEKMGIEILDN